MSTDQKTLPIDDLYCAAFVALRTRLVGTEQIGPRTTFFFDNSTNRATEASLDYINGPSVNLREFISAFREMKSVAFASRAANKQQK